MYGLISLFVRHPTAANLLMAILVLLGVVGLYGMNKQFFPTLEIPAITISVSWPGASAEDVEKNIIDAIEPEVRFLDDIEDVTSIAREGAATISLEFYSTADMQKALSAVEQAISRITTLPEDSEEPVVSRITFYEPVAKLALSGPFPEAAIKRYAKQLRDGLLNSGIDRVTFTGARSEEIWVQVRESDLRRLDLTLSDISSAIKNNTRDLPSGTVEGEVDVQLRSLAEKRTPEALGAIEVRSLRTGEKVYLRDIANVATRFDDDDKRGYFKGKSAIELSIQRAVSADTLKTMKALNAYLAKIRPTLPKSLNLEVYEIRGKFVSQRLGILINNGLQGLAIVLIVLFVFLNARIAFWVAMGIPIAFMATLFVMYVSGQSINMVSMFALIMMLGIIVDDAIVVGEHAATRRELGDSPLVAAERGAVRMLMPVLAATLTTQAAFLPIFLIQGRIGDIMSAIPLVVTAVLVASVVECFLILPGHLRHGGAGVTKKGWFRRNFDNMLDGFRDGAFNRFVRLSYDWRYTTIALTIASLILAIGLIAGGRVGFRFFPSPEPENMRALVVFGAGTPVEQQKRAMLAIEKSLYRAEKPLVRRLERKRAAARKAALREAPGKGKGETNPAPHWVESLRGRVHSLERRLVGVPDYEKHEPTLIEASFITLGKAGRGQGDNLAEIRVQLTPSEERTVPTKKIMRAWRRALPKIAGVERIAIIGSRAGPPGRDVDVRLQDAPVAVLKKAAEELKQILTGYPGVNAIADDLPYGKPELILELTPRGLALGFTSQTVGTQVRNAFEGAIATRFARGDEEITVRILRRQEVAGLAALGTVYLRSPSGRRVPLTEVVTVREKTGFSTIQRRDGVRTVAVTGDIDSKLNSTGAVIAQLEKDVMANLAAKYGLKYEYKGRAEERANSFRDLKLGALLALALIYIILAWVFESYAKPLAVMAIIPFGVVGAILGHMAMGVNLTIISMIGLLGLSGILVNDSIILMSQVKERLLLGEKLEEAAIGASRDRLRAVLLTSLTTIGGLLPLLFETSRQAQFLIPMAITLVFGLAAATILVLILVPALVGVGGDIGRIWRGLGYLAFPGRYGRQDV